MAKLEIKSEQLESGVICTEIFVDGNQIKGVRGFSLRQDLETNIPILSIDLNAMDLSVDCPLVKVNQSGMGTIKCIEFENGFVVKGRE